MIPSYILTDLSLLIFKSLWEAKDEAYKIFSRKIRQAIFYASEEYEENFKSRHAVVKHEIIGEPVSLKKIYIEPVIVDQKNEISQRRNKAYNFAEIDFISKVRKFSSREALLKKYPFIVVKGESGIGKTTFLKKVGIEAFDVDEKFIVGDTHMPVFLEIPRKQPDQIDFREMIKKEFEICGFPECDDFTDSALKKGKLLILIDNLDYLPIKNQRQVLEKLDQFSDSYNSNRFILACQDSMATQILDKYHDIHLVGFGSNQIRLYIQNIEKQGYQKNNLKTDLTTILSGKYKFSRYILHNPLYLNIALSLLLDPGMYHLRQTVLYEKILNHLIWTNIYKCSLESSFEGYSKKNFKSFKLLSNVAYECLALGRHVYHISELNSIYEKLSVNFNKSSDLIDLSFPVEEQISSFFSILNDALCQFSNPLIQKLLVAHHLTYDENGMEYSVEKNLYDPEWKDVFIFFAGLQGADGPISKITYELDRLTHTKTLLPLLIWTERYSRRIVVSPEKVVRRIYALNFLLEILLIYKIDKENQTTVSNILRETKKTISQIKPNIGIAFLDPKAELEMRTAPPLDPKLLRGLTVTRLLDISIELAEKAEISGLLTLVETKAVVSTLSRIKTQLEGKNMSLRQRKVCEENIYKIWTRILNFPNQILDFNNKDFKDILEYCRSVNLVLSCLKESFYVSSKMYNSIIESLFEASENDLNHEDGQYHEY